MKEFKDMFVDDQLAKYQMKHHISRLQSHTALVGKYLQKIIDLKIDGIDENILIKEISEHDASKTVEPELMPYRLISWFYKCKKEGKEFPMTDKQKEEVQEVTFHHVKNNTHHPEYWCKDATIECINPENRNKSNMCIDCIEMPLTYVATMIADWSAVSEEYGTKAKDWADANIDKRWKFSDEQKSLIYELIEKLAE
jgi:predicted SprT family Zn-dependent metalloprotease